MGRRGSIILRSLYLRYRVPIEKGKDEKRYSALFLRLRQYSDTLSGGDGKLKLNYAGA
ncbi:MAG: hypothetical protein LC102_08750 [Ignavibacteriales bacterium]|nr:hypothetical protein [Ignavibacteria bacterium]MBZ0197183.1 hypothetical protein [Ignavibacteriaceae bacterium]MCZ2143501.1 hypothetical protein [Ignavibacteriales bacterium]WKZ72176.1 MAG: hypothetical protein QY308_11155 [Ignavibacteriaceae bacterium]